MNLAMRVTIGALIFLACSVAARAAGPGDGSVLILDETAYCRAYYRFDVQRIAPATLKAEGEKSLGPNLLAKLEKETKKRLAADHHDWSREDWRDHVIVDVEYNSFARKNRVFLTVGGVTEAPADDWRSADFDDLTWPRLRKPDGVGSPAQYTVSTTERNGWLRGVYLRFHFEIPDPATAGALTFSADYIGGLRAFVNGQEIARGHLPSGELDGETMAQEYPQEAYLATLADLSEKEKAKYKGKEPPPGQVVRTADELTPLGSPLYKLRNRTLSTITIPPRLLRKGGNVLAIELRAAPLHPFVMKQWFGYRDVVDRQWEHARLSRLELRSDAKSVPSSLQRPAGVQVWTEDMTRRVYSPEYLESGAAPGAVRLVGARNGTYSAQVIVGTEKPLQGVKLVASELKSPAGGTIGSASIKICGMKPQPMSDISSLGEGRIVAGNMIEIGGGNSIYGDFNAPKTRALAWFAPRTMEDRAAAAAALERLKYFDWITAAGLPQRIAADSCQPHWLSAKIPADAAPGLYKGTVRVEGPDFPAISLPVELEVLHWRVPDPRAFTTIVAIEQSPYGVARQYQVPLWSDRHFELLEASLRQLGRVGNDVWHIPVLCDTEFGNRDDSMIRWIRRRDGSLSFDYSRLDRYLDLVLKHCGEPRVVDFVIMHGFTGPMEIALTDEATGKTERASIGPNAPDREKLLQPFARALHAHMAAKKLAKTMHWGYGWDLDGDPKIKDLLAAWLPDVAWICGAHDAHVSAQMPDLSSPFYVGSPFAAKAWEARPAAPEKYYKVVENIQSFLIGGESRRGWKPREQVLLCTPRTDCGAIVVNGTSTPWTYRIFPERAIFTGYQGTGRAGGDYWAASYFAGCRYSGGAPGFSIMKCLWPGDNGAEPSARFEAMIEGLQELEARIAVERALDRGGLPSDQTKRLTEQLARHYRGTFALGQGWQARSKAIYQLAGELATAEHRAKDPIPFVPGR